MIQPNFDAVRIAIGVVGLLRFVRDVALGEPLPVGALGDALGWQVGLGEMPLAEERGGVAPGGEFLRECDGGERQELLPVRLPQPRPGSR